MRLFFLIFFSLYGSLQLYLYWRVKRAFRLRGWPRALLAGFAVLATFGPMLARQVDRLSWFRGAQVAGLAAYYWMVVSLWVFFFGVLADAWNLSVRVAWLAAGAARRRSPSLWAASNWLPRLVLSDRRAVGLLAALVAVLTAWGAVEASSVRLKTVVLRSPRLAAGSGAIRLVQVSDLHLGLLVRKRRLGHVLELVRQARPDLVVCTGDMVDHTGTHMEELAAMLARVNPRLGKFAVTGNHEMYAGLEQSLEFLRAGGFRVLRGERVDVGDALTLAGVDDPAVAGSLWGVEPDEDRALPREKGRFTVLLKHRPEVRAASLGRFDLQISGHTHGGQIFPFTELLRLVYVRRNGLHALPGGGWVYISRGTGTWGVPLRVGAPPEVTLFVIEPGEPAQAPASSR